MSPERRRERPRSSDAGETTKARSAGRKDAGLGGEQVEGRNAVRELLRAGRRRVSEVWLVPAREAAVLDEILQLADATGARVRRVSGEELENKARTDAPQGVLALAASIPSADIDDLLGQPDAFLLALDGVTDPRNLGAVLRVAETAGVTGVVLPRHRSAGLTPAAVKAAAGAVEHLALATASGVPALLDRASRAGVWSVGLDAGGSADVFALNVADRPLMVVLGAEGRGLARLTRERCDLVASIPMRGAIESLNVATAAAVACHAIARQRHRAQQ
jgi:23S rRNA (guanosine2251-2'-O)-methyltransferase